MDFGFLREKRPWGKQEVIQLGDYFAGGAALIVDDLERISRTVNQLERERAATNRSNAASMRILAEPPIGMPLNPELYMQRSKALEAMAGSEAAASSEASSILKLIAELRKLERSLDAFEPRE